VTEDNLQQISRSSNKCLKWAWHVGWMITKNTYAVLVGKPERKRP
jgi:hypothetical protein